MRFKPDEIASVIRQEIEQYRSQIEVREVGRVLEVGDGIARVYGLSGVMAGEMVRFPGEIQGLAFNLEESSVGVIILGDYLTIREGDEVQTTGALLSVPVGEALLGRVIDPLGDPLDGLGPIRAAQRRPVEAVALTLGPAVRPRDLPVPGCIAVVSFRRAGRPSARAIPASGTGAGRRRSGSTR